MSDVSEVEEDDDGGSSCGSHGCGGKNV